VKNIIVICTCLAAAVLVAAEPATKAGRFASKAGRFTIEMPGEPKEQINKIDTALGPIDLHLFVFSPDPNIVYIASYADYPEDVIKKSDSEKMLNGARDGAVKNINGKLDREKKITIDKHPGRDISIVADQAMARVRMYLVDARLYQVILVSTSKESVTSKDAEKFLDSFKLADKR